MIALFIDFSKFLAYNGPDNWLAIKRSDIASPSSSGGYALSNQATW